MRDSLSISKKHFREIDLNDPFFDSLRDSYNEFNVWFKRKNDELAYVSYNALGRIQGFLYLKIENGPIEDITPVLDENKVLKVGTFKIDAHGTKLGERFVKIIVDELLRNGLIVSYITIFPKFRPLINILERFGFVHHGIKISSNGQEDVYRKEISKRYNNPILDYPLIDMNNHNLWLMGIIPQYHTKLFPDSILNTESGAEIEDVPFTNSIYKVYVGGYHNFSQCRSGDCIAIYRTSDHKGPAKYRSVVTSLCTVIDIKRADSFRSEHDFIRFCRKHTVFSKLELKRRYKINHYAIKLIYNYALPKRPTRGALIDNNIIPDKAYIGLYRLLPANFIKLINLGQANVRYIIN